MLSLLSACSSIPAAFDDAVVREAARQPALPDPASDVVTAAEADALPAPVARWLRRVGVVGRPRVHNFVVEMHARLNRGPGQPWMETPVLQVSFVDTPARLFLLKTRMMGLPVTGLHAYTGEGARMLIRAAGVWDVVDASGAAFTRAETVTVLNDLCIFAPGALTDPRLRWEPVDDTSARVTFTNAPHTVSATLFFDETGDLVDFASDDRRAGEADGDRWTTPLRGHRDVDGVRLPGEGDAVWHWTDGRPSWHYGTFRIMSVRTNVPAGALPRSARLGASGTVTR